MSPTSGAGGQDVRTPSAEPMRTGVTHIAAASAENGGQGHAEQPGAATGGGAAPQTWPYIVAVDDDPNVLRAVSRDLRRRYSDRFRIVTADRGESALQAARDLKARHDPVALFLADQRMPAMSGIELLEQIKREFPDSRRVLLTAYADVDASIQAINRARIDYYLTKPWDPPEEHFYPVLDDLLDDWTTAHPPAFTGIRLLGHRWSPHSHDLRDFLTRSQVPFRWIDVEQRADDPVTRQVLQEKVPLPALVFADGSRMVRPEIAEVADRLGMNTHPDSTFYDLVIVGAGPAGLAAAVNAASEGLRTLLIDKDAPGGQAGSTSRIENYLGFPSGLTGADLTRRGLTQARRFGVEVLSPKEVVGLSSRGNARAVTLDDGTEIQANVVLIATGLQWRSLDVPGIERVQGRGVYYGATLSEAISCADEDVYVVGGANSAGQGALHFARYARRVTMLVRSTLEKRMSYYLVEQIRKTANVHVKEHTHVVAVGGDDRLASVTIQEHGKPPQTIPACSMFIFIGAVPRTQWLQGVLPLDEHGYVLAGAALDPPALQACHWAQERRPGLFETGMPGVFVAGDVRHGSIKRVASAVGEGAVCITLVHQYIGRDL